MAVAALALLLAGLRVQTGVSGPPGATVAAPLAAYGSALPGVPAPPVSLVDPSGGTVSLGAFRGRVVVLAFIDRRAADAADTAALLRTFVEEIGPRAARVQLLAVNTDPSATPAQLSAWAAAQGMAGRWRILTGSAAALQRVAGAYHIGRDLNGGQLVHTSATYVIDARGRERWVLSTAGASSLTAEAHALAAAVLPLIG